MLCFPPTFYYPNGSVCCGYHGPVILTYMGYVYSRGRGVSGGGIDSIFIHRSPDQEETNPNRCRELCVSPGNPNTLSLILFSWDFGDGFTVE